MFYCWVHGWSSPNYTCPACMLIYSSTSNESTLNIKASSNQTIEELEKKLKLYENIFAEIQKIIKAEEGR